MDMDLSNVLFQYDSMMEHNLMENLKIGAKNIQEVTDSQEII